MAGGRRRPHCAGERQRFPLTLGCAVVCVTLFHVVFTGGFPALRTQVLEAQHKCTSAPLRSFLASATSHVWWHTLAVPVRVYRTRSSRRCACSLWSRAAVTSAPCTAWLQTCYSTLGPLRMRSHLARVRVHSLRKKLRLLTQDGLGDLCAQGGRGLHNRDRQAA